LWCGAYIVGMAFAVIFSHRFVLNKYNSFIRASEIHVEKTYSVVLGGRQEAAMDSIFKYAFFSPSTVQYGRRFWKIP
jgi:hypothetical protein